MAFAFCVRLFNSRVDMKVTADWLRMSSTSSPIYRTHRGCADLRYYNADFREYGSGTPIVLVPGLAGGIDLVEPLARELAQHHHVITYQLRGESDCFALRRRFGLGDLTEDLAEFIAWRGLERPAVLGVSFGGVVALQYAARYPNQIRALGLQGVGSRFEPGLVQRIAGLVLSHYELPDDCPFLNQFLNLLFGNKPTPEQFEHAIRTCWQTDQSVMAHRLRLLKRLSLEPLLARVTAPTVVVSGAKDVIVSRANARMLAGKLANVRHEMLATAGHMIPVTHAGPAAAIFAEAFADF